MEEELARLRALLDVHNIVYDVTSDRVRGVQQAARAARAMVVCAGAPEVSSTVPAERQAETPAVETETPVIDAAPSPNMIGSVESAAPADAEPASCPAVVHPHDLPAAPKLSRKQRQRESGCMAASCNVTHDATMDDLVSKLEASERHLMPKPLQKRLHTRGVCISYAQAEGIARKVQRKLGRASGTPVTAGGSSEDATESAGMDIDMDELLEAANAELADAVRPSTAHTNVVMPMVSNAAAHTEVEKLDTQVLIKDLAGRTWTTDVRLEFLLASRQRPGLACVRYTVTAHVAAHAACSIARVESRRKIPSAPSGTAARACCINSCKRERGGDARCHARDMCTCGAVCRWPKSCSHAIAT